MDEWNEEFLSVEVERELEKHQRESLTTRRTATGASSKIGCLWLVGLVWLIAALFWAITELFGFFFQR